MLLLGWAVGKQSTQVDDWFLHEVRGAIDTRPGWLLMVTDWRLLTAVLAGCVGMAVCRRWWRLAAVVGLCPPLAIVLAELVKRLFERHKGGALAYPSGHVTAVITVMGMLVLVIGLRWWTMMVAVVASLAGMCGEVLCGYHYLTDVAGAALLGTAVMGVAAALVGAPGSTRAPPHQPGTSRPGRH